MNEIWKSGRPPKEGKELNIVPVHKNGEKTKTENYSGITLMGMGYKIYAEILRSRLERKLEEEGRLTNTKMLV